MSKDPLYEARRAGERIAAPFSADLLKQIRARFHHVDTCPYQGPRIFFENAGGSLTLKSVVEKTTEISSIPDNEGRDNPSSKAMSMFVEKGKADCAMYLGATSGKVFVGETGTECLFRVIRAAAMAAPAGGSIAAGALEHPATLSATAFWAKHTQRKLIAVPFDTEKSAIFPDAYAEHITPETRLATIIHTSPISGMAADVAEITRRIRAIAPDCYVIVDGIQHAAHGGVDVEALDVDAYALSPYKMFSRMNNGFAWVGERLSGVEHEKLMGKPPDFWELGTRDASVYACFSEVVRYLEWLGSHFTESRDAREQLLASAQAIARHEHHLLDAMMFGSGNHTGVCQMPGLRILGPHSVDNREGVVSLAVQGKASEDVVAAFRERGIRVHTRANDAYSGHILRPLGLNTCVRVSPSHYNTLEEIKKFLATAQAVF